MVIYPSASKEKIPLLSRNHVVTILVGYEPCVVIREQNKVFVPYPQGRLVSSVSETADTMSYSLSLGGRASVVGSADVGTNASTTLVDSDLSFRSVTSFTYVAGNELALRHTLNEDFLKRIVRDHGAALPSDGPMTANLRNEAIRYLQARYCGDEFVFQRQMGARLHIGFEATFRSMELKNEFEWYVKAKILFKEFKAGSKYKVDFAGALAKVNLIFIQEGGDQQAFQQMNKLPQDCVLEATKEKQLILSSIRKCQDKYQELLRYAMTEFPKHLDAPPLELIRKGRLNVIRVFSLPYAAAGYPELSLPPKLSPASKAVRLMNKARELLHLHRRMMESVTAYKQTYQNASFAGRIDAAQFPASVEAIPSLVKTAMEKLEPAVVEGQSRLDVITYGLLGLVERSYEQTQDTTQLEDAIRDGARKIQEAWNGVPNELRGELGRSISSEATSLRETVY